jgi:glycosyltransferase involved in cell wall biosynthesis
MQPANPAAPKLAVIWIDFTHYHLARLRAIQAQVNCIGIELVGGTGDAESCGLPFRDPDRDGLHIITLFPDRNLQQISTLELTQKLLQTLHQLAPEQIALCGYHRLENLAALAWAKATHRPAILMIESKQDDAPRRFLQESLKKILVQQFDSYLVGGTAHRQYLRTLGAPDDRIFEGYDVVDNHEFAEAATIARQSPALRQELGLPARYFMAACRFVPKKNLPMLLEAYRCYRERSDTDWALVLCGAGPLETELRFAAKDIPDVYFAGFHKGKDLGLYYGLASCFVHASIQEQWGLVVNEAMASGLPVLVSKVCGCVPNLVQHGVNGFVFDPQNPLELADLMGAIASSDQLDAMGAASQEMIQQYVPDRFGENLALAMGAARGLSIL